MIEIPDLPGDNGTCTCGAADISGDGTIVVGATTSTDGRQAYLWKQGVGTVGLGYLSGDAFDSVAMAVADDGATLVGYGTNAADRTQAFRWTEALETIEPLEDSGIQSSATDVSADGAVVVGGDVLMQETVGRGKKQTPVSTQEAFRWTEATGMVHLGDLEGGERSSFAYAVSANGSVIAGSSSSSNGGEAFIWDADNGIRSLKNVLESDFGIDLTGWHLHSVRDISEDGLTLVGDGRNPDGNQEGFVARIAPPGPGITVTPNSDLQTSEDGTTEVIHVVLDAEPADTVRINASSSDVTEGAILGATDGVLTLTFDSTNWNDPQQIAIQGIDDAGEQDGNQPYSILLDPSTSADPAFAALSVVDISVTNLDNDAPAPSNAIYVYDIWDTFETRQRGRNNTDHRIVVDIRHDDNGIAEASDVGIGGAQVTVELRDSDGSLVGTYTGTTDSNGLFYSIWIKDLSPSATYRAEVTDLVLAGYDWDLLGLDPTFLDDDEDDDGKPDQLLSV